MSLTIRELRDSTGMSQSEFAKHYSIPVSTLRKWEQGEARPAPYIVQMIAKSLPSVESALKKITARDGSIYYYDEAQCALMDKDGNKIYLGENLDGVKEQNLGVYLKEFFEEFYRILNKLNRDLEYDKKEDIIWS